MNKQAYERIVGLKAIEDLKASGASGMDIKEYIDRNVLLKTELGRINSLII
jgi:hypothetical protein